MGKVDEFSEDFDLVVATASNSEGVSRDFGKILGRERGECFFEPVCIEVALEEAGAGDGEEALLVCLEIPSGKGIKVLFSDFRGRDETCGFGHAVASDERPAESDSFFEKRVCEVFAANEGEAECWRRIFAKRDEVEDLGGDERGDGGLRFDEPLMEGLGIPFLLETGEVSSGKFGTVGKAVAADMEVGEGEAPDVFGCAVEVLVDRFGAPIEAFLGVEHPLGLAGGAAGSKEGAIELGMGLRELLGDLRKMRRGEKARHALSLALFEYFGKGETMGRKGKERRCGFWSRCPS